ncbi:sugar phosphate isomerase/epimerase family protein [Marinicrinis sediminis]|uniref:Sugar phosphate isomerase/epimerase family protein n=1 Tax=Marinicrinis sediminis TaxID=1652465 RepID=A0ABW5RD90_9BACL
MNISLCTISFRHELVSLSDLIQFAARRGFQGIELWGVHARSICHRFDDQVHLLKAQLAQNGLKVSMISDYVDFSAQRTQEDRLAQMDELIAMAEAFQCAKIRIFAGDRGSCGITEEQWYQYVEIFKQLSAYTHEHDKLLLIETHPGTLADCLPSTLRLLHDVKHPAFRVNLDFLHMWESGIHPIEAIRTLKPWVSHVHLKNVRDRQSLSVFEPLNVYAPSGSREGIVPLESGAVQYEEILDWLQREMPGMDGSIEWFGPKPFEQITNELQWIQDQLHIQRNQPLSGVNS